MMRVVIYARVSTGKQAASDLSIPDQVAQCERYCAERSWEVVKSFIDAGASATTDNRPEFQAMIAESCSRKNPFDVVVVHSQSRFARNTLDLLSYTQKLEKAGVQFISITQDMGTGDQADILRTFLGAMDEYQSKETSKHVKRSMAENARQGFWNGSKPPFGYETYEAERRGTKSKKKLRINTCEAETVKLIFNLYIHGDGKSGPMGLRKLANYLNTRQYANREGRPFRIQFLQNILRNSAYITRYWFNRTDSKTKKLRPESEWIAHETPRIIDDYTFQTVQAQLDKHNPLKTPGRLIGSNVLLSGMSYCASCGAPLRILTGKNNQYRYYKCSRKADHGGATCKGYSIPDHKLDDLVMTAILDKALSPERLNDVLPILLERASSKREDIAARIKTLKVEKSGLDKKLGKLYELIANNTLDEDPSLTAHIKTLQKERETLVRQIVTLENQGLATLKPLSAGQITKFSKAIKKRLLNKQDRKFAKAYLGSLIERIDASPQKIKITGKNSTLASQAIAFANSGEKVLTFDQDWCGREDSNFHPCYRTATSTLRVYQFRHGRTFS